MLPPLCRRAGLCVLVAGCVLLLAGCRLRLKKDKIHCPTTGVTVSLALTAPNGGEIIAPGAPATNITWTATGLGFIKLELSRDNGTTWSTVLAAGSAAAGSYAWTPSEGPSTQCLIRISDLSNTYTDSSDATFSIPFFAARSSALPNLCRGKAAWGDYDNDGKLDVVLIGTANAVTPTGETHLFQNTGGGTFSEIAGTGFINVYDGDACWSDLDNDGDLDLVIAGDTGGGTPSTHVYRNDGGGTFADMGNSGLPDVLSGTIRCAQGNWDGTNDIAIMGFDGTSLVADAYYNWSLDFTFSQQFAGITPVEGTLEWMDISSNGTRGLLVTGTPDGTNANALVVRFYWDISDGWSQINVTADNIAGQGLTIGDFDGDGYSDFAIVGYDTAGAPLARVYINDQSQAFNDAAAGLTAAGDGAVVCGDFNNDGNLDLIAMGSTDGTQANVRTTAYWGDGAGGFSDSGGVLTGVNHGQVSVADWDLSSDLDALLMGETATGGVYTTAIQNVGGTTNAKPPAPLSPNATPSFWDVTIDWAAPADDHTPANALFYNVRVGTSSGADDILSGQAQLLNGFRRVVGQGAAHQALSLELKGLADGTYFYSIQAIDGNWEGGDWSTEGSFVIFTGGG